LYGILEILGDVRKHMNIKDNVWVFHIDEFLSTIQRLRLGTKLLAEELYRGPCDLNIKI